MYLKSLELHGFKSFPNRTVLTFEQGATVIVGPNGSGKSNISDAMRWVLGERNSRDIRGTKMEDVIFGGTDDRRPMGFAEVTVTFDNSDPENRLDSELDEVSVTRRYYRTGESEYLINRQPKRLKDIQLLFMNTGVGSDGYSIIGQGKVQEIVSKKSDDRRTIFEEAAGISKFRARKEESERKLKGVSENLERINDIKVELENTVGPLEKEAEKAKKGLALYEEKKRADVSLWLFDTKKIRVDISEATEQWMLEKHELDIIKQSLSDLEAQDDNLFNKTQSNKLRSAELLEGIQKTTTELHALENTMSLAESEFNHSAMIIEECQNRISDIERSYNTVKASKDEYSDKLFEAESTVKELADVRLEFIEESQELTGKIDALKLDIEHALDDITVEENAATDLKIRIDVLKNAMASDGDKSEDIRREIEKYEAEGHNLKKEADKCEENVHGFKVSIEEKDAIINSANEKLSGLNEEKEDCLSTLNTLVLDYDSANRRADDLQRMNDHFDGYIESVKFVMREYNAGKIQGAGCIYGPLSTLIKVEKNYITAIETALGASLQNIVVENEETAKASMKALLRGNAGRATFYPITSVKPATETDEIRTAKKMEGFVGRADTLVSTASQYRSIIEMLLLRTLVFDNIDNASMAAKRIGYKVKMVTLDGQVINANGSFTGGSAKRDSGVLTRTTEIASLREKAEKLNARIGEVKEALAEIDDEIRAERIALQNAEQEKEALLVLSRAQFQAYDNAIAQYEANNNILGKFRLDLQTLITMQDKADEEIKRLGFELDDAKERIEALREYRLNKAEEMGVLDERRDEVDGKANDAYVKVVEARKGMEGIRAIIDTIDSRLNDLLDEKQGQLDKISDIKRKRESIFDDRKERKSAYEALEKKLEELNEQRREVESGTDEFERELASIRQKTKEKSNAQQTLIEVTLRSENRVNLLKEKQEKLGSYLQEEYDITYEDAIELNYPTVTEENRAEIASTLSSLKGKLRALGNFNPDSIERYAQTKTRYDELVTQYNDLTSSQNELVGIIDRIQDEMRTSFIEAFTSINKHFGITFKELFGGGNAELALTDPEDVLTSGIEIKAAPPGKIIKSMSLLSGGEQSFVAIALLFAILKVNPTPFCILDEIEAALDEVNVYRFGEYVKRLGEDTQFILITHRRGTMEIGDRLYGVTMPQRGISQAIELNVNEIEGKQKELLDGVL